MRQVLFNEKEKQYMNKQPISTWTELREGTRLIIKSGEIVGFEKENI